MYATSAVNESYFASSRPLGVPGIGCAPGVGAPDVTAIRSGRFGYSTSRRKYARDSVRLEIGVTSTWMPVRFVSRSASSDWKP